MTCPECNAEFDVWGFCTLCDRCLKAKLWDLLEGDDYVLVRRKRGGGHVSVASRLNGDQKYTNVTLLNADLGEEIKRKLEEVFP